MNTHKVIVYSTKTCPYCVMAKEYLSKKGVEYTNIDVGSDRAGAQEMITKSGQMGVPVIDIDGEITVGFNPDFIDSLLK